MRRNASTSDRALLVALAIFLATVSASVGAAMGNRAEARPAKQITAAPAPTSAHDLVLADLVAEHRCLSEALYYEARGEGQKGQQAVAEVVFRRMNLGNYGHSICAVVYEGYNHRGCQFSFTCNGALNHPRETDAWQESEQLAAQILTGQVQLHNSTGNAVYYHAVSVRPSWAPKMEKTAKIGNHIFYRDSLGRARNS
jgi:spore germination cell wall hydrolase CwlJ-like protein